MPSWPTQSDYKDALQNPDTAFRDPTLKASLAERSPMGVPRARSGAFASVYKMVRGTRAVALKLFNFPNQDRAGRYRAVSDYLRNLGARKPAGLVGFEYHAEGIRVGKWWYPTLTMEWVRGKALGEWVREALERRNPDAAAVRALADSWVRLVEDIQAAEIAHGDLQHDNVMVINNQLVLVDYDGMCVPSLAPADPRKRLDQLEFGKPAYQHPARAHEKLGLHLDHFSAWVILVALRAAAADPALHARFVTHTGNENLLFSPRDMESPATSALWPELLRSKDVDVREWARVLRATLDRPYRPFSQLPPFALDPFLRLRTLVAFVPRDWTAITSETDRLTRLGKAIPADLRAAADPLARLRELCRAPKKDFAGIAAEADGLMRSGTAIPPDLKPTALDAVKRINCRDAVRKALGAKDPRAAKLAFIKPLLEGWAEGRLLVDVEAATAQVAVLDRIKAAVASPGDGRALVKMWAAEGGRLAGIPEAETYGSEAKHWRERIEAAEAYLSLADRPATEQRLADAWQRVVAAGRHADISADHAARGELAARRAPLLARLARVPGSSNYANDCALIGAWGDGTALAGCAEANPYAARVSAARDRVAKVIVLQRAIDAANTGTGAEETVIEAARALAGYDHPHAARVALAERAVRGIAALRTAVAESPQSDRRIASVLDELRATNVDLLARLDKLDPALAAAASEAGRRRKVLEEFAEIDRKYPHVDKQDRKWQALWTKHKSLLLGRRDTEELRARLTLASERTKAWTALEQALDLRDVIQIRELYEQNIALLRDYPPLAARRGEVGEVLTKADRIIGIQHKLAIADVALAADDLQFLRENHSAFGSKAKEAVVACIEARLAADAKLVAGRPALRVVPNGRLPMVVASWKWAGHGFVSHCLMAVDKARHLDQPDEADEFSLLKCRIEDHEREGGGKRIVPPPGVVELYLTIWAAVDLGWTTIHGPPLHLGPVGVGQLQYW